MASTESDAKSIRAVRFTGASLTIASIVTLALVSSTRAANDAPTPKVAVLVSAGDGGGALEDAFQAEERTAQALYEKLGFKVILIGGVTRQGLPLTASNFVTTLNDLSGVKDLRVDFIGHGDLSRTTDSQVAKGLSISKERLENGHQLQNLKPEDKIIWSAANSVTADSKYFGEKARRLGLQTAPTEALNQEHIAKALDKFHQRNPDGIATLNLENCYSGALAQRLRKDPGTIVYAEAPHNTVAYSTSDTNADQGGENSDDETVGRAFLGSRSGLSRYYQLLNGTYLDEKRKVSRGVLDFETVRMNSNGYQADGLRDKPHEIYSVGRSPIFESVIGWCEEGHPQSAVSLKSTAATDPSITNDECDIEKSQDQMKSTIVCKLQMEIKELKRRLTYAANSPNHSGEGTMASTFEKNYQRCVSKKKSPISAKITGSLRSYSQNSYPTNPAQPIQMMIRSFEKILADPAEHHAIVHRFKNIIEHDFAELRKLNLPEERWGGLRQLLLGLQNKTLGEAQVISKIKLQLENLKKICSSDDVLAAPCSTDGYQNLNDLAGYLFELSQGPDDPAIEKCTGKPQRFDCIYAINPRHSQLVTELNSYWSSKAPKPLEEPTRCQEHAWMQYMHAKKNVELDAKCVADFIQSAPKEEWDNLKRLMKLGRRDARGNGAEPANASSRPAKIDADKTRK